MQTLAAYLIFLLVVMVVGLAIVFGAIITLTAYEVMAWIKERPGFRRWQGKIVKALRDQVERKFPKLRQGISIYFHRARTTIRNLPEVPRETGRVG